MSIFEQATTPEVTPEDNGQGENLGAEVHEENLDSQEYETQDPELSEEDSSPEDDGQEEVVDDFDYKSAYQELRRDYTRKTQELSSLKKGQQPPDQGQGEFDYDNFNQQFLEDLAKDPFGTIMRVADNIAEQKVQNFVNPLYEERATETYSKNMDTIAKEYPELKTQEGYDNFVGNLQTIVQELGNPNLLNNPPKRILDMAAREAFGDTKQKVYQKAKAQGKLEAMNNIKAKQGLGGPQGAKPKETPKTEADLIRENIRNAGGRGGIFSG